MSVTNTSLFRGHSATRAGVSPRGLSYPAIKEALEIFAASLLLVAASPVLLLMFILVKLTSRGPFIYSQKRVGLDGAIFTIYKVRSMTAGCEARSGACWSKPGDPRVTPIGRILRKTHLDELPQLWNVIRGEMSLIGPRPERPEFVTQLETVFPDYNRRLTVKPGLTGLAQVQLPPDTDIAGVGKKLTYDLYYVDHLCPTLDLQILLGTVTHILGFSAQWTRLLFALPLLAEPEPLQEEMVLPSAQADAVAAAAG